MNDGIRNDYAVLLAVWKDYRDGIYEGDAEKLARIFHPAANLFYLTNGSLSVMPIAEYLNVVRGRATPKSSNAERSEGLVSLSIPSVDSAVLTATILITGKSFTDQLVFMKHLGNWLIVAKTYHLDSPTIS